MKEQSVKRFFLEKLLLPVAVALSLNMAFGQDNRGKIIPMPVKVENFFAERDTVVLSFIGDVMQHGRQLRNALIPGADPDCDSSYDYSYTFKYIEKEIENSDITVANMEFPVGIPPYTGYPKFSAPLSIAKQAMTSGIDLFLVANNHLMDRGERGISRTLRLYDSIGANYTGAYRDSLQELRENPRILVAKGVKIAFLNFTYGTNGFPVPHPYIINGMDSVEVKRAVARGFERGADIIVAMPHWGDEYSLYPNKEQQRWVAMLKRAGVRVIIGGHPHVPQTAECEYIEGLAPGERVIRSILFYSLGNYISNQSIPDYTQLELMVTITLVKDNRYGSIELLPPEYRFLWCFKAGEFEKDYTVVPADYFKNNPVEIKRVKEEEYKRMENTCKYIRGLGLYKELYHE